MNRAVLIAITFVAAAANAQSPQVQGQLRQVAAQWASGQAPASQIFGGFAQEGVEMPYMLPLEIGRCYTFVGTVGPGVEQLSIYLFDPTGRTVVKDTQDRSITPHMTWCPKWPGMYKLLGKIKRGNGEFAMQAYTHGGAPAAAAVPPPPPPAPAPVVVAPPPAPTTPTPPPGYAVAAPPPGSALGGQLRSLAAQFAPGHIPASQIFGGFAQRDVEMPYILTLEMGRCYVFVGTVGPGVEQLSIYLFDPSGKTVIKDTTDRSIAPHMQHCARYTGPYKLLGKIKRGQGEFAMQAYGYAPSAPAPQ
jgi:hypothetical protein